MSKGRALVTGAAKRLGRAMALSLARGGHDVAVHYATSRDDAEDLVAQITAMGRRAVALQADLLEGAACDALVGRAVAGLGGPLTVLVNNASIFEYDNIESATRESWDRHFDSNLRAPFVLTQHFAAQVPAPDCDDRGEPLARGLVVNMIDQRVRKLTPEFMTYTLAKMGLWAFTRTAAQAHQNYLTDFDWQLQYVLSSSTIASLREPLVLLLLRMQAPGAPPTEQQVELSAKDLDAALSALDQASGALTALRQPKQAK